MVIGKAPHLFDVGDDFFFPQPKLFRRPVDDPLVRLVKHQVVDFLRGDFRLG